jgi:transposase
LKPAQTIANSQRNNFLCQGSDPDNITAATIDMSPAFIKGISDHLPNAKITFDKFHVIAHASQALDDMRRREQKTDPALKGLRWALLKDRSKLSREQAMDLDRLVIQFTTKRTARLALSRATAQHPRSQTDQRRFHHARAMVHQRHAFQGRAHEGRRRHDPQSF